MNKTTTLKVGMTAKLNGRTKVKILAKIPAGRRPTLVKFPTLMNANGRIRNTTSWIVKGAGGNTYWAGVRSLSI